MKRCDLCGSGARMHCESDQASLCWDCDAEVHGANFLVARHSRSLLCHTCQAPTPWTASGAKLVPTASFCRRCASSRAKGRSGEEEIEGSGNNVLEIGSSDENSDDDDEEEEEQEEDESDVDVDEEVENQVVPLSSSSPPPLLSSSSCEDSSNKPSNGDRDEPGPLTRFPMKRPRRNDLNLRFQDDLDGEATSLVDSLNRPQKDRRTTEPDEPGSRSITIFGMRFPVLQTE